MTNRVTFYGLIGSDEDAKPMCQSCSGFSYRLEGGICEACWEEERAEYEYDRGYV